MLFDVTMNSLFADKYTNNLVNFVTLCGALSSQQLTTGPCPGVDRSSSHRHFVALII